MPFHVPLFYYWHVGWKIGRWRTNYKSSSFLEGLNKVLIFANVRLVSLGDCIGGLAGSMSCRAREILVSIMILDMREASSSI